MTPEAFGCAVHGWTLLIQNGDGSYVCGGCLATPVKVVPKRRREKRGRIKRGRIA